MIVRDILDIVDLRGLLKTLLVWWCTTSKRSLQIELSWILIFGRGWMNSYDCIVAEAMIAFSVTVAWVRSIYWWSRISDGSGWLVVRLWVNGQISDSCPVVGRQDLLGVAGRQTSTVGIGRWEMIHLQRRDLRKVSDCFLVLLTIFSPRHYTPIIIGEVLAVLGLTVLLMTCVGHLGREEGRRSHGLLDALHLVGSVADHTCRNWIITLLNSTRTCNSHI